MGRRGDATPRRYTSCHNLLAYVLPLLLSVPIQTFAQTPSPGGPSQRLGAQAPSQPAEAPPQPPAPTPPPPTIPSTTPPVFPSRGAPLEPAATFELHPSITLSEEYTDNFNLSRRNKQENFRTSLSPGLSLLINRPFVQGQIALNLSAVHDSITDETRVGDFGSLAGQVSYEISPRLRLTVSDALTRSDDPGVADALSLRRERRTFTSNTFSLSADYLIANVATREYYRLGTFFDERGGDTISHTMGASASTVFYQTNTASLGYEYLKSKTSGGADTSGRQVTTETSGHQVTASLARQMTTRASAGAAGSYAWHTVTSGDAESAFRIWSVSFFSSYAIPNKWSLTGSVGFSRLESDAGADTSSVTSMSSFTSYHFAPATLTLTVDQGFSQTFAQGQNFGVVETRGVTGSLSYPVTPFISGSANAFFRQNEFTGVGGGQAGRMEDTWGGSVSFAIQLLRWLTMGLEYGHREATSSGQGGGGGFTENHARASLHASF